MAKSSRASRIKKNNQALKKRVFDPVETARNDRLSAKLLELAQKSKEEAKAEEGDMQLEEQEDINDAAATAEKDVDMDLAAKPRKSNREIKRKNQERSARIDKKYKKPRNLRHFPSSSKKKGGKR